MKHSRASLAVQRVEEEGGGRGDGRNKGGEDLDPAVRRIAGRGWRGVYECMCEYVCVCVFV
jgi:hypothetical protein